MCSCLTAACEQSLHQGLLNREQALRGTTSGLETTNGGQRTVFWAAREVGPAREGIQKKPSVSKPSSATLDRALHAHEHHLGADFARVINNS